MRVNNGMSAEGPERCMDGARERNEGGSERAGREQPSEGEEQGKKGGRETSREVP